MNKDDFELVFPYIENKVEYADYRNEYDEFNERPMPYAIHHNTTNFQNIVEISNDFSSGKNLAEGAVPSDIYWFVKKGGEPKGSRRILGGVDIRKKLNNDLKQYGGHIGYGIRPTERNKGYAKILLSLALDKCIALGIAKVFITCEAGNTASSKTILANGGELWDEVLLDGMMIKRYWIDLGR